MIHIVIMLFALWIVGSIICGFAIGEYLADSRWLHAATPPRTGILSRGARYFVLPDDVYRAQFGHDGEPIYDASLADDLGNAVEAIKSEIEELETALRLMRGARARASDPQRLALTRRIDALRQAIPPWWDGPEPPDEVA